VVADVVSFFGQRGVPYLLWVREGVDEPLLAAGRAAGLRDAGGPPGMVLPTIGDIPSPPPGLELRIATSPAVLDDHRTVVAAGFGMPPEIAAQILGAGLLGEPGLAIVVGYLDRAPVTTALVSCTRDTAGVYNVATLPGHRGKGFGAAATWAVIAEGALRGCTHSVLQSSVDGYPVYRRMGFVDVGQYVQLEGPPA
jgi:GNAT superfamily N-acetyltransferase